MRIEFFYFMISFLIPRLMFQWGDHPQEGVKTFAVSVLIEALLLTALVNEKGSIVLLLFLPFYHISCFFLEKRNTNTFPGRIIEFLLLFTAGSFIFGILPESLSFNKASQAALGVLIRWNTLLQNRGINQIKHVILYTFGSLVLINEMNHIIRYILGLIKTEPQISSSNSDREIDNRELGRGKIIGVIERLLFFLFVLTGHYSSIGFILAAKGFTRFKELDDKNFAEYVLIGTLLSSAFSIFWAFLIEQFAKAI